MVIAYGTGQNFNAGIVCTDDELPFPYPYVLVKVTTWVNMQVEEELPTLEVHYPDMPPVQLDRDTMTTWRQLASFLGQPIPFFPPLLRRRDLLEQWRPGAVSAVALPVVPDHDVAALYTTAAMENDPNSVVARTLIDLGHARLGASIRHTEAAVAEIEKLDVDYCLTIAARPATVIDRGYDDRRVPEQDRRAAWMDLFHRTDELAAECVDIGYVLDSCRCFPYTHIASFHNDELQRFRDDLGHSVVHEWLATLQPSLRTAGHQRIEDRRSTDRFRYLEDPATGAPVVEQTSAYGLGVTRVVTLIPERLPTTDDLAVVILEGTAWVRTTSGTLYLMPVPEHVSGHAWGYGGTGPGALAATIETLLEDITAPGKRHELGTAISSLTKHATGDGIMLDRATLIAAKRKPIRWDRY
ncbi:hypothetical protein CFP71_27795 [Amycolatopsis thailandensis]|uniref:Uncharacterized protein n=1 Tax=Amycolatopsis thailandensis TaxID=589330 RepID=A0A229RUA7_9PSEU|nr:hypothetical protein CFP71_27795 [Amycolatopsis thailandensis]